VSSMRAATGGLCAGRRGLSTRLRTLLRRGRWSMCGGYGLLRAARLGHAQVSERTTRMGCRRCPAGGGRLSVDLADLCLVAAAADGLRSRVLRGPPFDHPITKLASTIIPDSD
jgi:hypothetical protein